MIDKLCQNYGKPVGSINPKGPIFYSFPNVEALNTENMEPHLRELGFGYRAKFIAQAAKFIVEEKGGDKWLMGLREVGYEQAKEELLKVSGGKFLERRCVLCLKQYCFFN
jgi:N-glycosylase/DNA lyase